MATYEWNYDAQVEKYVTQFLRVFAGIQVRDGVQRDGSYNFRKVPVMFGDPSRIIAHVINKRQSFPNPVIPLMAGHITAIQLDTQHRGPTKYHKELISYQNDNGTYTETRRLLGPPFILSMELAIYASSNDEMLQILEQLLLIFNPKVTIQKTEDLIDHNYLTQIELSGIDYQNQSPLANNEKLYMTNLQFEMPIRLNYPHTATDGVVEEIVANMYDETVEITKIDDITVDDTGIS